MRGSVKDTVVQLTLPTAAKSPTLVMVSLPPSLLLMLRCHALPEPAVGTKADTSTVMLCELEIGVEPCAVSHVWCERGG